MNVLIAGAGPTGLTLAIDLARRGIAVRLIDQAADYFEGSRGDGLQPRTMEVFEDLGVMDEVIAQGIPMPAIKVSSTASSSTNAGWHRPSTRPRTSLPERAHARPVPHRGHPAGQLPTSASRLN